MKTEREQRLWYKALEHPLGIKIKCADPIAERARMIQLRTEINDPALNALATAISPDNPKGEIWIYNKEAKNVVELRWRRTHLRAYKDESGGLGADKANGTGSESIPSGPPYPWELV